MTARRGFTTVLATLACAGIATRASAILPEVHEIAAAECCLGESCRGFRFTVMSDGSIEASYCGRAMFGCRLQEGWVAFTFADVQEREFAGAQVRALGDGRLEIAFCRAVRLTPLFAEL
jgi:hypothetical protein